MALFKKDVKDELEYEDPSQVKKPSVVEKVVKNKFFIPAVALVVLLILVRVLFGVFASQSSDMGYYDTMTSIFSNELGSFSYTLSVETGDKGTIITSKTTPVVEEIESGSDIEADVGASSGREFVDWGKYADVKLSNWQHPVFQVNISGTTMSVDPLVSHFVVTLATPAYNNKFTEVTVRDDTYYFDVESIYNWLNDSSDSYLISLAKEIPHGSKWLEVPASEFAIPSRYAESGDEQALSAATSLRDMYQRFVVALKVSANSISGSMGDRGIERKKEVVYLNLTGDDANALFSATKSLVVRSGDFYESLISNSTSGGWYTESQQKQAIREKDNFIEALNAMSTAMQMSKASDLDLKASGQVRQYTNGYGSNQIEGTFGVQFSSETTDYLIKFTGIRSGDKADIEVPEGSKTKENADMYLSAFNKIVDYFNFTPIKTDVKLNINPDTISEAVLDKFIKLVNDTGKAGYWVTRDNVGEYIETYRGMSAADLSDENDLWNTTLVSDLVEALEKIVPNRTSTDVGLPVVTKPTVPDNTGEGDGQVEQFPGVTFEQDGLEFRAWHNDVASNHDLFVLSLEVLNRSGEDAIVDCGSFVIHDLLDSIYPANNEILIRNYDNLFDMDKLLGDIYIPAKGFETFDIYFVIAEDAGHSNLFYGDTNLGAVIQY